ncbi:MAG: hypothetical protein SWY16_14215 [Cyanobacteriota bacterium]|nr:hypothetical protein [Cyanobacteriota bacterium]
MPTLQHIKAFGDAIEGWHAMPPSPVWGGGQSLLKISSEGFRSEIRWENGSHNGYASPIEPLP